MLFNSLEFVLFFPIVTLVYFGLPGRFRWIWLVAASAVFYMAFVPRYILILGAVIGIDYISGLLIEPAKGARRKAFLAISLVSNVLFLSVFKYWNFMVENIGLASKVVGAEVHLPILSILLPIGLSFHTFQSMSYTIEVYRGSVRAERHLGIFALYVLFYPQLVAGPIERPQNLLHQFHAKQAFDPDLVVRGLRLMLWGFVKKVLIADRFAETVNLAYGSPSSHSGPALLLAAYLFSFQIYCDFSAYSDIARGAARVMGYDLMVNFRRPYFSTSMGEFWRRWHISLSTWFRDYVYVPLGGGRGSNLRRARNIAVVFLLSGLWHGSSWHFIVWGALNGALVMFEGMCPRAPQHLGIARLLRMFWVFNLSTLCWIFFRADSIGEAWTLITRIPTGWGHSPLPELALSPARFALLSGLVGALLAVDWSLEKNTLATWFSARPRWARWTMYYTFITLLVFGSGGRGARFIYFQF